MHVECRASRGRGRLQIFARLGFQSIERKCQAKENKGDRPVRSLSHVLIHQPIEGRPAVMTSDTLDIRGPIPLTRAGVQVSSVLSLMFVLCNLSPVNRSEE